MSPPDNNNTMTTSLHRYWSFWITIAKNNLQQAFVNKVTNLFFLLGKSLRLFLSTLFLLAIKNTIPLFDTYTTNELLLFFLTYQVLDVSTQALFRGVYSFAHSIRSGEFDFFLLKPINPLFQSLLGNPDINDVIFLLPTTGVAIYLSLESGVIISLTSFALYAFLLLNALLIATALHIAILAFGIITMEVDGLTWLYRDLLSLGQYPIGAFDSPLREVLTFVVPVAVMITVPAQSLFQAIAPSTIALSLSVGIGSLLISLKVWNQALKQYTSASS